MQSESGSSSAETNDAWDLQLLRSEISSFTDLLMQGGSDTITSNCLMQPHAVETSDTGDLQSQRADQLRQPEEGSTDATTQPEQSGGASASDTVRVNGVADLRPLLRGVPVKYRFDKHGVTLDGFVAEGGYACACAPDCELRRRGKALSALQFEKHAVAASKNQNDHIFLPNNKSLYALFHQLRDVPALHFSDTFQMAAGVPMTVPAAPIAPPASAEQDMLQTSDVTAEEPPSAARAQEGQDSLTEEQKAIISLLDLSVHNPATESAPMDGIEWPCQIHHSLSLIEAADEIENAAHGDHEMPDVVQIRITGGEQQPMDNHLSAATHVKVQVMETKHRPVRAMKKKYRKKKYRPVRVSETKYQQVQVTETKYKPDSLLKDVRGLLLTGLLEGFRVAYKKNGVEMAGRIDGQGYSCGCSQCGYSNIMNACEFELHAGQSTNNQNDHIFLETGISLYKLIQTLKYKRLDLLGDLIEEQTGLPPNLIEYEKWKASFQADVENNDLGDASSDPCLTQRSQEYPAGVATHITRGTILTRSLKKSTSNRILNLDWSPFTRPRWQYKRANTETSAPTLSINPEKGTSGLSTGTTMKSGTEEIPSENTTGVLSEVIKLDVAASAAVVSRRPRWQYKRASIETSAPTLRINPEKGTSGLSTCTTVKSDTEETLSENTTGLLSSEVRKRIFDETAAVLSTALSSPVSVAQAPPPDHSMKSKSKESRTPKVRDNTLHPLVFKEGGLPELTLLTYKLKYGEALKQGYKRGSGIVCDCCNEEFTPSQFEDHAGMGRRRQPYRNIYTSEGLTLHELALKLQSQNSNGVSSVDFSDIDEPPNIASSGRIKEPSTIGRPIIVPFKRTLQERAVIESCHLCGDAYTAVGKISDDMIIFCNQCERPCHVKCYNNGLQEKKAPLNVLAEYMKFHFFCCQKCQLLHASLHHVLNNREKIRHKRSNVYWHLLSGINLKRDVQHYMDQVIGIFKVAFPETAISESDVIQDMVTATDDSGKKDYRGMFCAVLTTKSKLVLSAAILKVRTEEVAELVLAATHHECRKKGYFRLLLRQIEAHLSALNVRLLTAPVDPEMVPIWSKRLGFTILSDEEKEALLERQPLVMFQDLPLMQISLAIKQPELVVSTNQVTVTEPTLMQESLATKPELVVSTNQVTVTEPTLMQESLATKPELVVSTNQVTVTEPSAQFSQHIPSDGWVEAQPL